MLTRLYLERVQLFSPGYFRAWNSGWRDHIRETWQFLQKTYIIDRNPSCGTHVRLYLSSRATLQDLKRVAQAIIHFEPAFMDLVPPHRRRNCLTRRYLGRPLSRLECIDEIERAINPSDIVALMQEDTENQKYYSWNVLGLTWDKHRWVEFRQPPGSVDVEEFLSWAELALLFVGAALLEWDWSVQKEGPTGMEALYRFVMAQRMPGQREGTSWRRLWPQANRRERGVYQVARGGRESVIAGRPEFGGWMN